MLKIGCSGICNREAGIRFFSSNKCHETPWIAWFSVDRGTDGWYRQICSSQVMSILRWPGGRVETNHRTKTWDSFAEVVCVKEVPNMKETIWAELRIQQHKNGSFVGLVNWWCIQNLEWVLDYSLDSIVVYSQRRPVGRDFAAYYCSKFGEFCWISPFPTGTRFHGLGERHSSRPIGISHVRVMI